MITDFLPYVLAIVLFSVGLYAVVCKKNLVKIIVGVCIMDYGVNLFLILIGYKSDGIAPIVSRAMLSSESAYQARMVDPLPQALILTSIVIGLATVALMVAIAIRIYEKYGTFDITQIRRLRG
ncbi:MAG: sodium:proton antiporter [Planctomycetota bacterium]